MPRRRTATPVPRRGKLAPTLRLRSPALNLDSVLFFGQEPCPLRLRMGFRLCPPRASADYPFAKKTNFGCSRSEVFVKAQPKKPVARVLPRLPNTPIFLSLAIGTSISSPANNIIIPRGRVFPRMPFAHTLFLITEIGRRSRIRYLSNLENLTSSPGFSPLSPSRLLIFPPSPDHFHSRNSGETDAK